MNDNILKGDNKMIKRSELMEAILKTWVIEHNMLKIINNHVDTSEWDEKLRDKLNSVIEIGELTERLINILNEDMDENTKAS